MLSYNAMQSSSLKLKETLYIYSYNSLSQLGGVEICSNVFSREPTNALWDSNLMIEQAIGEVDMVVM